MMHVSPQLVVCKKDSAVATAGFIAGYDAGAWLTELELLGVLHQPGLELYILPVSAQERTPAGLFFAVSGISLGPGSWRTHPYKVLAGCLAIPLGTMLSVPLTSAETRRLFPMHRHVLHPGIGHVAFEPEDQVLVSELVETPCILEADWHQAHPGLPPSPLLSSVGLQLPAETATELLEEGKGDIGTQADDLVKDVKGGTGDAMYRAKRAGLLGLSALGGFFSRIGGEVAQKTGARSWTQEALRKLEETRNRELDRLLRMLKENPKEGLKYALPLNSRVFARGEAPPSATLGQRSTRFSLSGLGGGSAVDAWQVQEQMLEALRQRYREAAAKHREEGDYDQAAYIHAQLLGDYHTAALVLKEGKRYQEAAKIYQDLLKRPLDAARCLEEGGMLQAAAELYAELEQHEAAGDLYERCGNTDEARLHFRRAVDQEVSRGAYLKAATLLESRLGEPEEAEQLLLQAWPDAADAVACMGQYLARREAAEDHGACLGKLRELAAEPATITDALRVLHVFSALRTERSAHAPVAIDHGIMLVGRGLQFPGETAGKRRRLLGTLHKLVPGDALLLRDSTRFLESEVPPKRAPRRPAPTNIKDLATPPLTLQLPTGSTWSHLASNGESLLALGSNADDLTLLQMTFQGEQRGVRLSGPVSELARPRLLWSRQAREQVAVFSMEGQRFLPQTFARSAAFPEELVALTPSCVSDGAILHACEAGQHMEILHYQDEIFRISRFEQDGAQLPDREVEVPFPEQVHSGPDGIGLWHWQGTTNLVMGLLHATVAASGAVEQVRLPASAICTAVSAPFSVYRVAIADDQGIHLYWPERDSTLGEPLRLTYDFVPHCMLFLANGMLAAADETEVRVFRTKNHKADPLLRLPNGAAPVALARGPKISDLAVLRADGSIGVYTLA